MLRFLSLFIGMRFKQGRRRGSLVSLISIISTLSISLGMIVLIVGLGAMNGFERELRDRILAVIPHAEFSVQTGNMNDWKFMSDLLEKERHIISVSPYVSFSGLLENGTQLQAVLVRGIEPQKEREMSALAKYVVGEGWQKFEQGSQSILIGKGLATKLNVKAGDRLTLLVPSGNQDNQLKTLKRIRIQIAGILALSGGLGNNVIFIPLELAQRSIQSSQYVTGLAVNVDNPFNAHEIVTGIAKKFSPELNVKSWENEYGYMYQDIQMIRSIMYLAMILVIAISCFSIVSTLIIAVKDKQSDIAILKTLGASDGLIKGIFLVYGGIVGLIGSTIGTGLGILIALNLSSLVGFIELQIGHKVLDGHIYFIDFMPSELRFRDVAVVFFTTLTLSLVASYYPARRACRTDPAQLLSYK